MPRYRMLLLLKNKQTKKPEAMVRTRHGTMDCFEIGKGVCQGCILSACLFNLHTKYIMWNSRLDEITSWNQYCWEKLQQTQIDRCHHPNGRKGRGTIEPLDKGVGEDSWESLGWQRDQTSGF